MDDNERSTKMKKLSCALGAVIVAALLLLPVSGQAGEFDLTTAGTTALVGGAWFYDLAAAPTGTGNIDSFVRISSNAGTEQGYNTSGRPVPFDENTSPTFTRDLQLSAVPIVNIGGTNYREFLLDINQTSNDPLLSLDEVRVYQAATGGINSNTFAGLGTAIYDMDAGGADNWVKLNYNLNSGSGSGDMLLYVPTSLFGAGQFVYLYSEFGEHNANNDGFEEWAVRTASTTVPEPGMLLLLGVGLVGVTAVRRRIKK
jgi:hypothetical protein